MNKELYINGSLVELDADGIVALTLQINDVANLESRNGNFSNQIKIPFTKNNNAIFENANNITSSTNVPYTNLSVKYVDDGVELIPLGFATLDMSDDYYEITIYNGNSDLFALIDGLKLDALDLHDLNHVWNTANIIAANANTSDYIYPLIDYSNRISGSIVSQQFYQDSLFPAFYVKTLVERIVEANGWTLDVGVLASDERWNNAVLALSQKFQNKSTFFDAEGNSYVDSTGLESAYTLLMKFVCDATASNGLWYNNYPTTISPFNPLLVSQAIQFVAQNDFTSDSWVAPQTKKMSLSFDIEGTYVCGTQIGLNSSTQLVLLIYNKTQNTSQNPVSYTVSAGASGTFKFVYNGLPVYANAGDVFQFVIVLGTGITSSIQLTYTLANITFQPYSGISEGDMIIMADQLPDMSQSDFLKAIMNVFCVLPDAQSATKTLQFRTFQELINNLPNKKDWSSKWVEQKPNISYLLGDYYQINDFVYKQDYNIPLLFGNNSFNIDNQNLTTEGNVVELPFGSSIESTQTTIRTSGAIQSVPDIDLSKTITPRILILRPTNIPEGILYMDSSTGLTTTEYTNLPFCHFVLQGFKGLSFTELLYDYWQIITSILNKTKAITCKLNLKTLDVYNFNFLIPIFISQLGNDFYVNKIGNYKHGQLTDVELVRIDASTIFEPQPLPGDINYRSFDLGSPESNVHIWKSGKASQFKI